MLDTWPITSERADILSLSPPDMSPSWRSSGSTLPVSTPKLSMVCALWVRSILPKGECAAKSFICRSISAALRSLPTSVVKATFTLSACAPSRTIAPTPTPIIVYGFIRNCMPGMAMSEPLNPSSEKAFRKPRPTTDAFRLMLSSCCSVCLATDTTLPLSALSLMRNFNTLSIAFRFCFCLSYLAQILVCVRPLLVRERVGIKVQIVAHYRIEKEDVEPIGHVHLGIL